MSIVRRGSVGLLLQAVDVVGLIGGVGCWSMNARERRWPIIR
ncbi:MAG: hypothetical protein ACRDSG_11820 [Pseudonocardiaceae bacterium]